MKKRAFLTIFLLVLLTGFVIALNCPPSLPKIYSGQAYYKTGILGLGGEELLDNYEYPLRAVMNGEIVGEGTVIGGDYSIKIIPCSGASGEIIFVINGVKADTKGSYEGQDDWGKIEELNLIFSSEPPHEDTCGDNAIQLGEECDGINFGAINSCGDGWTGTISCTSACKISYVNCTYAGCGDTICNNGETCSTCSSDCGACPTGGDTGGGSSDSGGSNKKTTPSSPGNLISTSGDSNKVSELSIDELNEKDGQQKAGITGQSILDFAKSGIGIGAIIFILAAGLVFGAIKFRKKIFPKKDNFVK